MNITNFQITNMNISGKLYNSTMFFYDRFPNFHEIKYISFLYSTLQVSLGSIPYQFGNNPTSRVWMRDITIAPSIILVAWKNIEIGSTNITHDYGEVIGLLLTSICKVSVIGSAAYFSPESVPSAGISANFICGPLLRTFKVTSREFQKTCQDNKECSLSYTEFMWENLDNITVSAVKEVTPKTFTSNFLIGHTLKDFFEYLRSNSDYAITFLSTQICLFITGQNVDLHDQQGIYNQASTCIAAGNGIGWIAKTIIYASNAFVAIPITFGREIITAYIFGPLSNSVADGPIPNMLFDSAPKVITTALATTASIACTMASYNTFVCMTAGISLKAGLDTTLSYYTDPYEKTDLVEENTLTGDLVNHEDL
ncbi:MAG: hypothetical protein HRU36_04165 [Rickettsiales bacterium]|nr:hypothetical protein [Rickettsiales bacterium]